MHHVYCFPNAALPITAALETSKDIIIPPGVSWLPYIKRQNTCDKSATISSFLNLWEIFYVLLEEAASGFLGCTAWLGGGGDDTTPEL